MSETISVHNMFSPGAWNFKTSNSMNNLLSYSGLVDAKIRASYKDLPVIDNLNYLLFPLFNFWCKIKIS